MWPFPKKHFQWREPKEFRRTMAAVNASKSRWWHNPLVGLIWACCLMAVWGLAGLNPNNQRPPFEIVSVLALSAGLFLAYFLSWIDRVAPSTVMVFGNRLFRTNGRSHQEWKFADISSFEFVDCDAMRVLVLELRDGRQFLVGMPLEVNLPELREFLISQGLLHTTANPLMARQSRRLLMDE